MANEPTTENGVVSTYSTAKPSPMAMLHPRLLITLPALPVLVEEDRQFVDAEFRRLAKTAIH